MMRRLVEAVLTLSDHFGEQTALELEDTATLAQLLDVDPESEFFESVVKLADELRHKLGALSSTARQLNNHVKYGEKWFNDIVKVKKDE